MIGRNIACMALLCGMLLALLPGQSQAQMQLMKVSGLSPIPFLLVDSATGQVGQTGKTGAGINVSVALTAGVGGSITVTVWKPGGAAYVNATGSLIERGNGVYVYVPVVGDSSAATTTDNILNVHMVCSGCQIVDRAVQVVAFDPNDATRLGISALPNANAGASGGLPLGNGTGQVNINLNQLLDTSVLPLTNASALSVGTSLWAAHAQGIGIWTISGTTETMRDITNAYLIRSFTLSPMPIAGSRN